MKNFLNPLFLMKTLSKTLHGSTHPQQSSYIILHKLCQVKEGYSPVFPTRSLSNSSILISTVCHGIDLFPDTTITKLKNLSVLLFAPDKDFPGKEDKGHEKILEEQQKQLEKLKTLKREGGEKFPKYKPKDNK